MSALGWRSAIWVDNNRLLEECTQEEARIIIREEKMGEIEDQALKR